MDTVALGLQELPHGERVGALLITVVDLVEGARRSDTAVRDARAELVRAVR